MAKIRTGEDLSDALRSVMGLDLLAPTDSIQPGDTFLRRNGVKVAVPDRTATQELTYQMQHPELRKHDPVEAIRFLESYWATVREILQVAGASEVEQDYGLPLVQDLVDLLRDVCQVGDVEDRLLLHFDGKVQDDCLTQKIRYARDFLVREDTTLIKRSLCATTPNAPTVDKEQELANLKADLAAKEADFEDFRNVALEEDTRLNAELSELRLNYSQLRAKHDDFVSRSKDVTYFKNKYQEEQRRADELQTKLDNTQHDLTGAQCELEKERERYTLDTHSLSRQAAEVALALAEEKKQRETIRTAWEESTKLLGESLDAEVIRERELQAAKTALAEEQEAHRKDLAEWSLRMSEVRQAPDPAEMQELREALSLAQVAKESYRELAQKATEENAELRNCLDDTEKQVQTLNEENTDLSIDKATYAATIDSLQQSVLTLRKENAELRTAMEGAQAITQDLRDTLKKKDFHLNHVLEERVSLLKDTETQYIRIRDLEKELSDIRATVTESALLPAAQTYPTLLRQLQRRTSEVSELYEELDKMHSSMAENITGMAAQVQTLTSALNTCTADLQSCRALQQVQEERLSELVLLVTGQDYSSNSYQKAVQVLTPEF
jgi:DNA repair exonuclease SbcCD ATPase subunit